MDVHAWRTLATEAPREPLPFISTEATTHAKMDSSIPLDVVQSVTNLSRETAKAARAGTNGGVLAASDLSSGLDQPAGVEREQNSGLINGEGKETVHFTADIIRSTSTPVGVGMAISVKKGIAKVTDLVPGSSAWGSSHISRGDRVKLVDGVDVRGKTAGEIVRLVKGEEGSMVVMALQKAGEKNETWVTLERRQTAGIGIAFERRDDGLLVESIHPDGAAAKSEKLKVGDKIIAVDGRSTEGKSVRQVVATICGPQNSTVSLTIQRGERLLPEVVLHRTTAIFPSPQRRPSSSSDDSDSSTSSSDDSEAATCSSPPGIRHWKRSTGTASREQGGIYGGVDASRVPPRSSFRQHRAQQQAGKLDLSSGIAFPEQNSSPSSSVRTSFSSPLSEELSPPARKPRHLNKAN